MRTLHLAPLHDARDDFSMVIDMTVPGTMSPRTEAGQCIRIRTLPYFQRDVCFCKNGAILRDPSLIIETAQMNILTSVAFAQFR